MNEDLILRVVIFGGLAYLIADIIRHEVFPLRHLLIWKHVGCFISYKRRSVRELVIAFVLSPFVFGYMLWAIACMPLLIVLRTIQVLRERFRRWRSYVKYKEFISE